MKQKHGKIKLNLNFQLLFYQIQTWTQICLWLYVPVILCLSRVNLQECKSSWDKNKTSARQPSLPDTQLKVHHIYTSIETLTSNLCHIWYWNNLPQVQFPNLLILVIRTFFQYFQKVFAFELLSTHFLFIRLRNSGCEQAG